MDISNTVRIKRATYENIYFECPFCQKENVINRASELKSYLPISGKAWTCENCKQDVWLNTDRVTQADYMWFLGEVDELKQKKEYRDYILTLCQGVEMFFVQALINYKLDRNPMFRDGGGVVNFKLYNFVRGELERSWKAGGYALLRDLFREEFKAYKNEFINSDGSSLKDLRAPSFKELNRSRINELRNKVVHSTAYRPTLAEVNEQEPLLDAITWLGEYLRVTDSVYLLNRKLGRPKLEDIEPEKVLLARNLYHDRHRNNMSVEDICKQLGIGRTTLYRYVGEKE